MVIDSNASAQEQEIRATLTTIRAAMASLEAAAPDFLDDSRLRPEDEVWGDVFDTILMRIAGLLDRVLAGTVAADARELEILTSPDDPVLARVGETVCNMATGAQRLATMCASTQESHGCRECALLIDRIFDLLKGEEPDPDHVEEVDLAVARTEDPQARAYRLEDGPPEPPWAESIQETLASLLRRGVVR